MPVIAALLSMLIVSSQPAPEPAVCGDDVVQMPYEVVVGTRQWSYLFPAGWKVRVVVISEEHELITGRLQGSMDGVFSEFFVGKLAEGKTPDMDEQRQSLLEEGREELPDSVEKEIILQDIDANGWTGFYYCVTDADAVLPADEHRYLFSGCMFSNSYLCYFRFLSDSRDDGSWQRFLAAMTDVRMAERPVSQKN